MGLNPAGVTKTATERVATIFEKKSELIWNRTIFFLGTGSGQNAKKKKCPKVTFIKYRISYPRW